MSEIEGLQQPSKDRWLPVRICVLGAIAGIHGGSEWILDFWSLYAGGSIGLDLRGLFELSQLLMPLLLAAAALSMLVSAILCLWKRRFRRAISNLLAVAVIPACCVIVSVEPVFDPWLWYAMINDKRFEAIAASRSPASQPKYAVITIRDVSVGLVSNGNHFVALIYDGSDQIAREPWQRPGRWRTRTLWPQSDSDPIPRGTHLYRHLYRVDEFD